MEDKEKIIAEIERIMAEEMSLFEEQCQGGFEPSPSSPVVYTRMQMLLKFINSLPEEPVSKDLEDAVNAYIGHKPDVDESSSVYGKRQAFKAGAQWKNEKFIDKACEWLRQNWRKYVWLDGDNIIHFGHWTWDFRKYMEEQL